MAEVITKTTPTINLSPCLKDSCSELASSLVHSVSFTWLPCWLSGKESTCQCRRPKVDAWVGKIPWRRKWQPTPVFLPGESHGQSSLVGYSSWCHKESDTTELLNNNNHSLMLIWVPPLLYKGILQTPSQSSGSQAILCPHCILKYHIHWPNSILDLSRAVQLWRCLRSSANINKEHEMPCSTK